MLHIITLSCNAHILINYVAEPLMLVMLYDCIHCVLCVVTVSQQTLSVKPLGLACMLAIADEAALNPHIEYF